MSLVNKKNPIDIADLTPYVLEDSPVDQTHPALNLFQAFFERADAENYGNYVLANLQPGVSARPLVQTYGLGDTYAPIPTMQVVASTVWSDSAGHDGAGLVAVGGQSAEGRAGAGSVPGPNPWPSATGLALPVSLNVSTTTGNVTAALLEADPMGAYDGHFVLFDDPPLQTEVFQFLGTAATGTPTIE